MLLFGVPGHIEYLRKNESHLALNVLDHRRPNI